MSAATRCVAAAAALPYFLTEPLRCPHLLSIAVALQGRCGGRHGALLHQRCLLSSRASATPLIFSSTHTQRDWNPAENAAAAAQASAGSARAAPGTPVSAKATRRNVDRSRDTAARQNAATPPSSPEAVHPYSVRAYRARLLGGTYFSLRELTRAAYAPSPLKVLTDLLQLSVGHSRRHAEASSSLAFAASSPAAPTPPAQSGSQNALSRARDVQHVLQLALTEAQDTVLAAQTIGDVASHAALEELLAQLEALANAMDACVQAPAWTMSVATHSALLHGLLRLAAATGSRLHALTALDDLLSLQERQLHRISARRGSDQHHAGDGDKDGDGDEDDGSFSMDDAVALVDAAAQQYIEPVTAQDHLWAMQACAKDQKRDFATALSLYRRFVQHAEAGRFAATPNDFSDALVALAHSSRTTTDFTELRALLIESEAAAVVPVSVPLYTAIIDAASRAVEEPQRMVIALFMYRRLRDGGLTPTADTYAALIACCTSTREPTHAFAFYHEARQVCGVAHFTPQVYTNLLLSYVSAGYGADARKTLDVLVEAGAPLSRASFHAVLAGAVTAREAQEVVELMTERYHIAPTPHTYAYVAQAVARSPAGVSTALQLFDIHEDAMRALAPMADATVRSPGRDDGGVAQIAVGQAMSTSADGVALEPILLERYPLYVRAMEQALMRLRVDLGMDGRLRPYLMPLIRIAQQRMNAFTGMPPQSPTHVPDKERLCIAVLAADVLAKVDEWVLPFISHYSVLVIPYSALVSLQRGGGRRVDGVMPKGVQAGRHDAVWQETAGGQEFDAVVEHRRRRLARFLEQYKDVIHLVSLEEELRWSRETRRYGVGVTDLFARAAVTALHLARHSSCRNGGTVYAQHANASIVLVSANYNGCGKYVVTLRQAYAGRTKGSAAGVGSAESAAGLRAALSRVSYHNPRTNPSWTPPTLAIAQQEEGETKKEGDGRKHAPVHSAGATSETRIRGEAKMREGSAARDATASAGRAPGCDDDGCGSAWYASAHDADAAGLLYRQALQLASARECRGAPSGSSAKNSSSSDGVEWSVAMDEEEATPQLPSSQQAPTASTSSALPPLPLPAPPTSADADDKLDAFLLMSLLND
ncbi:conserved hypothetical protein [Leishmania major strain Friedlin]|uniref:Pentacotripeptide-repeat region of PRORP domain-containing protein n=1 Tax=Leishmania major TaxID=5664 RepID=Q4QDV1_LEIMA|nr:conserved hypothetical protein [Leishmania major strain Friedlin]CAG9572476.1 hypothetical_protein_-_conserved [Leishmania major strain Friedlin]CAJ03826.1 conserved hypothetical protein [Leishmania major strain Friedlin]|eukprot:XP_001682497.1 conserved hypothetical protein [Leishmania major strain Friedlin]